jgi:hypothetical protein
VAPRVMLVVEDSVQCGGRGAREHVPCPLLRVHRLYPGSEGKGIAVMRGIVGGQSRADA